MAISLFSGDSDGYWWILCTEDHFRVNGVPKHAQLSAAVSALQVRALHWWRWWYPRHPDVDWESFTTSFIWRFQPEFREILPMDDEEEEPHQELSVPTAALTTQTVIQTQICTP
ncbi:hypothetical protein MTR_6g021620 [Medicago truncatula]|uniref:Swarming motility protein ybiA n=1 Tax=Medicago truncatula TaxID=3880 RepID=G7KMU0_MEDTR|nr:hypothetical protein MTR_6g021620 [Medicago truncatula]